MKINHLLFAAALATAAPALAPLSVAQAQAGEKEQTKVNVRIPLDGVQVAFNGQTFTLSGSLHGTLDVKQKKDGTFIKGHFNAQGISATSADGTTYRGVGAGNFQVRTESDGATFKGLINVGLIGQGQNPNVRLKVRVNGTVDAQGQLQFSVLDGSLDTK